jgi:hypothetical protein
MKIHAATSPALPPSIPWRPYRVATPQPDKAIVTEAAILAAPATTMCDQKPVEHAYDPNKRCDYGGAND